MYELKNKNMIKFLVGHRIKFQSRCQIISKKQTIQFSLQELVKLKSSLCQKTTTFGATLLLILT